MTLKTKKRCMVKAVRKRMLAGHHTLGAPVPASSGRPFLTCTPNGALLTCILFLTAFITDLLRFEVHFSSSVRVLRKDSAFGFTNEHGLTQFTLVTSIFRLNTKIEKNFQDNGQNFRSFLCF